MQSNLLPDIITDAEMLYRVVKRSRPDCITKAGTVSPALFKDANGVSVDRDGGRAETEIIRFITQETFPRRAKAVASLAASRCFEVDADVQAAPSSSNPFHANIYLSTDERRENLQALMLADSSVIIYINEKVAWV